MKNILTTTSVLLLGSTLFAQQGNLRLDADGNYTPSYQRTGSSPGPGPDAPGDLYRTFAVSNATALSGYAPFNDDALLGPTFDAGQYANLSGGNAEMYGYQWDGTLVKTVPVTDVNDSWPGYDGSRKAIICVNAFDDTISGYNADTGAPLFRFSTPTAGPVGCAYDSTRDAYWYSDWTTNELIALDATDAHSGISTTVDSFSTAVEITRIAGVAYNCLDDTVVSGGRDQGMQVAYDAASKAVVAQWAVLGGSINDPQGCGLSCSSGVTTTDFQDLNSRVHEGTAGIRPGLTALRSVNSVRSYVTAHRPSSDTRAIVGWSNSAGQAIIKGVQTCLSLPAKKAGAVALSGTPGRGQLGFTVSGAPLFVQAATFPSKTVTNVVAQP